MTGWFEQGVARKPYAGGPYAQSRPIIPLVAPCITDRDRTSVAAAVYQDALTSERWVRQYEEAFAARVGCVGAVAVCSGTEALRLALVMTLSGYGLPWLPTYACSALYNAAQAYAEVGHGIAAELLDVAFFVRKAQMIQPHGCHIRVHAFGRETRIDDAGDLPPVEDYTLSLGGVPSLVGRVGVCSTHASKMLSTGRGGIVFSNDEALLAEVRALAYYDSTPNGTLGAHSLGMTSMQAALGLSQLAQLDGFIERRREIAAAYSNAFVNAPFEYPDPDCGSVFFRYLIGVDNPGEKVEALKALGVEAGRGVYPPLHRQLGLSDEAFPGATDCVNRLLSVPCHPSLSDADVAFVAEKVLEVCAP